MQSNSPDPNTDLLNTDSSASTWEKMTQQITCYFAAEILMNPSFPEKQTLPPIEPLPFTTFGHQPLFNPKLFHSIIWAAIGEIQTEVRLWERKSAPINFGILVFSAFISVVIGGNSPELIGYAAFSSQGGAGVVTWSVIVTLVTFAICLLLGFAIKYPLINSYERTIAKIRADTIANLVNGKWNKVKNEEIRNKIESKVRYYGSGHIERNKIPVVIILDDKHPFPGFGRLQAEIPFICPPKDERIEQLSNSKFLQNKAWGYVKDKISNANISHISFGELLAVHGSSIPIESIWLDLEKRPLLFVLRDKVDEMLAAEPIVSARRYHVIHVLFPEYMTKATFFLRFFQSGDGMSCHLAVTTLGPPTINRNDIKKALLKHQLEVQFPNQDIIQSFLSDNQSTLEINQIYLQTLQQIRERTKDVKRFKGHPNLLKILDLKFDPINELTFNQKKKYDRELNWILRESTTWPGAVGLYWINRREKHSLTFTSDFFGRSEAIASIKILYEQISRAVIDGFEDLGYDVSDYKDKEGKYTINADKIDQLVVGEKIHIEKEKTEKSTEKKATENKSETKALS